MKKQSSVNIEPIDICDGRADFGEKVKYSWHNDMRFPVFPTRFTDARRADGKYLRHINYPNIAVELDLEGEILYTDEENLNRAVPGAVFLIVPHSNVKMVNANPGTPRRKLVLIASGSAPSLICGMLGFDGDKLIFPEDPADIERRMREIGEIIEKNLDHRKAAVLFYELLLILSMEYNRQKNEIPPQMITLKKYIYTNINGHLSSENLADHIKMSESTLRRQVRRYFGCSPQELVCSVRLEQAAMLLKNTSQSIKEIAIVCGFHTSLYFGTLFKAAYGTTPTEFRKNAKLLKDVPIKYLDEE